MTYKKSITVGLLPDNGGLLTLELELKHKKDKRMTIDHRMLDEYTTLSICGSYRDGGGQCIDTLRKPFAELFYPADVVGEIADIWERWHLNDMNAKCVHQERIAPSLHGKEWELEAYHQKRMCPHQYPYGSQWLVEEIPAEVIERVKLLFEMPQIKPTPSAPPVELTCVNRGVHHGDASFKGSHQWGCTLTYKGESYSFPFYMGSGHKGKEPTLKDVLECLKMDASSGEYSFENFCAEFGYETDSRSAERMWKQCQETKKHMDRLFGDELDSILNLL